MPALHPTLAVLFIVLNSSTGLSEIRRNRPDLRKHKYYDPEANFPQDISNLLPVPQDRWWETLGESCSPFSGSCSQPCTAAEARQVPTAPPTAPRLPRVRLILPDQAKEDEDVGMEVDELEHDDYIPVSNHVFLLLLFLTVFTSPLDPCSHFTRPRMLPGKLLSRGSTRAAHHCTAVALESARPALRSGSPYLWRMCQMMRLR